MKFSMIGQEKVTF